MRNDVDGAERRQVVRHLLAGCPDCVEVTRQLWNLGDFPPGHPAPPEDEMEPLDLRETLREERRAEAAACHQEAVRLLEGERWGEALRALLQSRRLYRRLEDDASLVRLRHLEGKIADALGEPQLAEAAFLDARREYLLEGLGDEAAEALMDLAVLYARQGRSAEVFALSQNLRPILLLPGVREGVGLALLFFRNLAETEQATLEVLVEILKYVRPAPKKRP